MEMIKHASQNINLIGKVYYAKIKDEETTTTHKKIQKVNFGITLNNGLKVFIESTLWNVDKPAVFTVQKKNEYIKIEKMVAKKDEDVYISCNIYPSKDGTMFDKMSMYEKNDGNIGTSIRASVNLLKSEILDSGSVKLTIPKRNKDGEEVLFEKSNPIFVFNMIVEEKEGQLLSLIDDVDSDYPTRIYGELPSTVKNLAKVGQGYKFLGVLKRGQAVDTNVSIWDEEAKTQYSDNYMELIPKGIITGLSATIKQDNDVRDIKKKEAEKYGTVEVLPF